MGVLVTIEVEKAMLAKQGFGAASISSFDPASAAKKNGMPSVGQ